MLVFDVFQTKYNDLNICFVYNLKKKVISCLLLLPPLPLLHSSDILF